MKENDNYKSGNTIKQPFTGIQKFNYTWTTPSENSFGSMPVGNGDIGMNVWAEKNSDLCFYISKIGAYNANCELIKIGKFRISFEKSPFKKGNPFNQTLELQNGAIYIAAGSGDSAVDFLVWVDANNPVIHVKGNKSSSNKITIKLENERTETEVTNLSKVSNTANADILLKDGQDMAVWFHRNVSSNTAWSIRAEKEGVEKFANLDPLKNLTFGAALRGENLKRVNSKTLQSNDNTTDVDIKINVHSSQTNTVTEWFTQMSTKITQTDSIAYTNAYTAHKNWWKDFWDRSYIDITGGIDNAFEMSQNYTLQRFIQACQTRGPGVTAFNGSIFNVNVPKGIHSFCGPTTVEHTADWRDWGDLPIMWQNTRHIYHPLLASGDTDLMMSLIDTVYNALEVSRERTKVYYNHGGAFMPEGMMPFGVAARNLIPDKNNTGGAVHLLYHMVGTIEIPYYMLQYYEYSGDLDTLTNKILPVTESFVDYFDLHFPQNDENGKMIMSPSGAAEKYTNSTNPMCQVAGLYPVIEKLLELPANLTTQAQRDKWTIIYNRLPQLPLFEAKGTTLLAVAENIGKGSNRMETPELYAISPFQNFMIGKPNLDIARQSFAVRNFSDGGKYLDGTPVYMNVSTGGWNHNAVQSAYLGLPEESAWLVRNNLSGVVQDPYWISRPGTMNIHRFPAFWGPFYDWSPDQCHGGNTISALQAMLLQDDGKKIYLMPSWPENWDVNFKLHATGNTVIEAEYFDGKLEYTINNSESDIVDFSLKINRVKNIVSVASGDRNRYFGLAPMRDGKYNPQIMDKYKISGDWLTQFGSSINDTMGGTLKGDWGTSTVRYKTDGNETVYLHITTPQQAKALQIRTTNNTEDFKSAILMENNKSVTIVQNAEGYLLTLPDDESWSDIDTVIVGERKTSTLLPQAYPRIMQAPAVLSDPTAMPKPQTAPFVECYTKDVSSVLDNSVMKNNKAGDEESIGGNFKEGNYLVYKEIDFGIGDYKNMMIKISSPTVVANSKIEVRLDGLTGTKIGEFTVFKSIVYEGNEVFNDYYTEISRVSGHHTIYLIFKDNMTASLDWFTLTTYTGATETAAEKDARMQWWKEARFGQFIHMGAYSYLKGIYTDTTGSRTGTPGTVLYSDYGAEWMMNRLALNRTEYGNAIRPYNPVDFDAAEIVALAKATGQKYITFTTKHHDGFTMYQTNIRTCKDYSLFKWANNGNYTGVDPVMELSKECEKQGIIFTAYYTVNDWYDPNFKHPDDNDRSATTGLLNSKRSPINEEARKEMVYRFKEQMRELIVDYGVKAFWFDGGVEWWTKDKTEIERFAKSLNPNIIINDRAGITGDYTTPENRIPDTAPAKYWETCMVSTGKWPHSWNEYACRSTSAFIAEIVKCASLGGNYLLNQGVRDTGYIDSLTITNFSGIGSWLNKYGNAIYGSDAGVITGLATGVRSTIKGNKIYLFIEKTTWSKGQNISIPKPGYPVTGATTFDSQVLIWSDTNNLQITLPNVETDEYYNVITLNIDRTAPVKITKDDLNILIKDAKKLSAIDYKTGWETFASNLSVAETVSAKTSPTQVELTTSFNDLKNAIQALIVKGYDEIDRTALTKAISDFKKLTENEYILISWAVAKTAFNNANDVDVTVGALQSEVNKAATDLTNAITLEFTQN